MTRGSFSFSSLQAVLLGLCLIAASACKAKPTDDMGNAGEDLAAPAETCEQMRCVDPDAVCCNGEPCIDTKSNPQHCGACGTACKSLEACSNGQCVCRGGGADKTCAAGTSCCPDRPAFAGGCKNLDADTANCGSCGRSCRAAETCSGGSCHCGMGGGCSASETCCPMGCAKTQDDPNNCGACGKKCADGKLCKGGVCEGECTGCAMAETCCNGKCANLNNDPMNCGTCGKVCPMIVILPGICFLKKCVEVGPDGGMPPDGFSPDM